MHRIEKVGHNHKEGQIIRILSTCMLDCSGVSEEKVASEDSVKTPGPKSAEEGTLQLLQENNEKRRTK